MKTHFIILYSLFVFFQLNAQRKQVGILVFPGVQIIDFTGPYETFGHAGYRVFTVGQDTQMLTTAMNMKMAAQYDFQNAPQPDILVVPGGNLPHHLDSDDPRVLWVKKAAIQAEWVMSVCNGAFLLGSCGLLDGRMATTNAGMINHLGMAGKNIIPVYDQRVVKDGKYITTGGLSAGIDGALFIVSQIHGPGRSREIANNMEYYWNPDHPYVRSKLADMLFAEISDFNPPLRNKKWIRNEGDERYWKMEFQIQRKESAMEFYNLLVLQTKSQSSRWTLKMEKQSPQSVKSEWDIMDAQQLSWFAKIDISAAGSPGTLAVRFEIERT